MVGLGIGDPATTRKGWKCGVDRIVVSPDGNGWRFEAPANFGASLHSPQVARAKRELEPRFVYLLTKPLIRSISRAAFARLAGGP